MQSDTSDFCWKGDAFACSLSTNHIPVPHHDALVSLPTETAVLHRRVYIRHQTHTGPRERGGRCLEPTATAAAQQPPTARPTSPAPTAEDWPEEGLVAPEEPNLAAIAKAQEVDFLAMAAAQRSFPEVAEMMNSTTLQITTQAVGEASLLGDVSTGVFRPLVPIQYREAVFQSLHSIHHPMPPHRRSVLLVPDGQGHNTNGLGLLVLPARQGSQTRPPTTSRDTGSSPLLRPHPRQPGRPAVAVPLSVLVRPR